MRTGTFFATTAPGVDIAFALAYLTILVASLSHQSIFSCTAVISHYSTILFPMSAVKTAVITAVGAIRGSLDAGISGHSVTRVAGVKLILHGVT